MRLFILPVLSLTLFACKESAPAQPETPQIQSVGYDPEAKLQEMNITLPAPSAPVANFVKSVRTGNLVFLAVLKAELGDLRKVRRIVKVLGMVNCSPDFADQPEVLNGFSDLMVEVFGGKGKHARSAVGMAALPRNMAVEVEMIVEVEE